MKKQQAMKKLWGYIRRQELIKAVEQLATQMPNDEAVQLLNATLNLPTDPNDVWFTALAILCKIKGKGTQMVSGRLLQTSAENSGHPISNKIKTELICAIVSASKLTREK